MIELYEKQMISIRAIEKERELAASEFEKAKRHFGESLINGIDGNPKHIKKLALAREKRDAASLRLSDVNELLGAARVKYADACKAEYEKMIMARWTETALLAKERITLAKEIEKQAEKIAKDLNKLIDLSKETLAAAPKTGPLLGESLMSKGHIEDVFRLHLAGLGWDWASNWPAFMGHLSFRDRIIDGNKQLLNGVPITLNHLKIRTITENSKELAQ